MIRTLREIVWLGGASRGRFLLASGLGALAAAFAVALLTTAGYLISRAAEQPPILSLTTMAVAVRFFGLARPVARYLERLASHDLALRTLGQIRSRFFARIEPLAPAGLSSFRRGDLLTRMIADVDSLQGLYPGVMEPALGAPLVGMACIAVAFWFLPIAAVTLAVGLAVAAIGAPALTAALAARRSRQFAAARSDLHAELMELIAGAQELAVFGCEERALAKISEADRRLTAVERRAAWDAGLTNAIALLAAGLTVAAVLVQAVAALDRAALDRVEVAALTLLAIAAFDVTAGLQRAARELMSTLASGRRVLDLCAREPVVVDPETPLEPPRSIGEVALEGVAARYEPTEPRALEGLSLRLEAGRRVAIVGPSGTGKTTVVNLLLRFLDAESGRVTIGGRETCEYTQDTVRHTFAVAGQDAHLFDSSIRENLRLARPGAGDEALLQALELASIDRWVASLPEGLDTMVGEDGMELSGGQRQRLVLARAFLAEAPVLVLDEPTAHLDRATALTLMDDVMASAGSRSVLLITHRPEGLDAMDEVIALGGETSISTIKRSVHVDDGRASDERTG